MTDIDLEKENEQLKKENKELKVELESLQNKKNLSSIRTHKKIIGLMEENKELKLNNEKLIEMVQGYQKWSAKRSEFL